MNNSKLKYILFIVAFIIIVGIIVYFYVSNNSNNSQPNFNASRTAFNVEENKNTPPKETEIAKFSTDILDDSEGRLKNIKITCDTISGTIIETGKTFSFNDIVGQPSKDEGYEEAAIIVDHHREDGIGGGNCQVSSTLYNAVLAVKGLTVVERHQHGEEVGYVPLGKDATISYGSLDFKFKNDTDYKIKVNVSSDDKKVTATIFKIED